MNIKDYYVKAKLPNWKKLPPKLWWKEGLLISMPGLQLLEGEQPDVWGIQTSDNCYKIDTSTICRRTGLPEKNNNAIWENDIVRVTLSAEIAEGCGTKETVTGVVCFDAMGIPSIRISYCEGKPCYSSIIMNAELAGLPVEIERIGNVYDEDMQKAYEIGLYYDERYSVITIQALDEEKAVETLESMINTAKEYQIVHIKEKKEEA